MSFVRIVRVEDTEDGQDLRDTTKVTGCRAQ